MKGSNHRSELVGKGVSKDGSEAASKCSSEAASEGSSEEDIEEGSEEADEDSDEYRNACANAEIEERTGVSAQATHRTAAGPVAVDVLDEDVMRWTLSRSRGKYADHQEKPEGRKHN